MRNFKKNAKLEQITEMIKMAFASPISLQTVASIVHIDSS